MKYLIVIFFLFAGFSSFAQQSQGNDTSKYVWYKYQYGSRMPRYQADSVLNTPKDTTYSKTGIARKGTYFYVGNGTYWTLVNSSTQTNYNSIDSATTTGNEVCLWSLGVPFVCFTINSTPGDTTIAGVDSVIVQGNLLCQWKAGVSTCYTISNTIINNTNNYITNVYTGVDSVVVSGTNLCQWSGGIATCYTISTAPGDTTISGIDSVTIQGSQLCQWKAGVSTCYTVTNTINNSSVTNYIDSSITNVYNYLDSSTVIINSGSGLDSIRINGYQICFYLHDSASPRCWQLNTFFDDVRLSDDSTLYEFYNGDSLVKTVPSGIKNVGAVWPLSYNGVDLTTSKPFNDSLYLSSLVKHSDSLFSKKLTGDSVFVGLMSGSGGSSSGIDSMYVTSDSLYQVFIYSSGRRDSVGYSGSTSSSTLKYTTNGYGITIDSATTNLYRVIADTTVLASQSRLSAMLALKLNITDTANIRFRPIAGTNVTLSGTYPNITIAASGSGSSSTTPIDSIWRRVGVVFNSTVTAEGNNTYEPSVIYEGSPQILTNYTKVFKMWYTSGWGNISRAINYAESVDGITWTHYASNPIVTTHSRSSVLKDGSTYYMYATNAASTQVDRYTSSNGVSWTLATSNVLGTGTYYNTSVIVDGSTWRMLVDGYSGGTGYVENYYTSPDGITWTAYGSNPVISGHGGSSPFLKKVGSNYYCWLGDTNGTATLPTDIYRYSSPDMITWTRTTNPVFPRRQLDEGANNALGQVQDVYIAEVDSSLYMFHAASPNGNDSAARQQIKLSIADASFYKITQTQEGDGGGVIKATTFLALDSANIYYDKGSVAIGASTPSSKAILDLTSTTKSFLPPRMTNAQMVAIVSPATGSVIYNTTTNTLCFYNGTAWQTGNWSLLGNTLTDSTTQFLGTINNYPLRFKLNNNYVGSWSPSLTSYMIGGNYSAMTGAATGNSFYGYGAGIAITSSSNNSLFGNGAGQSLTTGNLNVAIGYHAMFSQSARSNNVAVGNNSLGGSVSGDNNVAVGTNSGGSGNSQNTSIGTSSLTNNTGSTNSAFGSNALGGSNSGSKNLAMGAYAGYNNTSVSNQLFINYDFRNTYEEDKNHSWIYGVGSTTVTSQRLTVNGKMGVNQNTPTAYLQLTPGSNAANLAPLKFTQDSIVTTAASGNGTVATITFASQNFIIPVNATVRITGVTPSGYNGTYVVTASTATSVSFASATTGVQTVAGRVTTGVLLTTPEAGAVEYDGANYYVTDKSGTRRILTMMDFGTAAPATTPTANGTFFLDTTNKKLYVSTGTASSADWTILN